MTDTTLGTGLFHCVCVFIVTALATGCAGTGGGADLVLRNGRIVTLDPELPEVQALAAAEGVVTAVGSDDEIDRFIGKDTRVIDLQGRLAIPGFIEGHGHLAGLGRLQLDLDLTATNTWEEIVGLVAAQAGQVAPGSWIVGRGWHQEKWTDPPRRTVEGFPANDRLDEVGGDHPVLLVHASGHAAIANTLALDAAGIDRSTPDPPGGTFLKDGAGELTGVLIETAEDRVRIALDRYLASRSAEEIEAEEVQTLEYAMEACLAHGVTSFQDAGSPFETVDRLRRMADQGKLKVRLWVMLSEDNDSLTERIGEYRIVDAYDRRLTVRAIKRLMDGALGSRGAWLLEPYSDMPGNTGLNTIELDYLAGTAAIAVQHRFQLCVHAIGDRGNREVLDLYAGVLAELPDGHDRRWRIEHAQHLHPDDIPRFAELGVIAAMQGIHCTSDGPFVTRRLGENRASQGAYVWRSLIDSGAVVSNGTDTPVEPVDPIAGYHALVTREMGNGERFHPEQAMTREEALRAYTVNAAFAAFEEEFKGTLAPGRLADIAVLSRDILAVPEDEIRNAKVLFTIVGGEVLYEASPSR